MQMSGNKTQSTKIHRHLWLYKQRGSRCWYARVYLGGTSKAKTTGTSDERLATEKAEAFFQERLLLHGLGLGDLSTSSDGLRSRRFDKIADDWLKGKKGTVSEKEWRNFRNLLTAANGPGFHFNRCDIGDITTDKLRSYLQAAEERSTTGKLSPHTLKKHLSLISGILRLAAERRLIPAVPPMPKVPTKDVPRSWFTRDEYKALLRTARQLASESEGSNADTWNELADWIGFMVNCFLRPSEWPDLRHRHIVVREGQHPHLEITVMKGKTGVRVARSMPSAIKHYRRIAARTGDDLDGFVFKPLYHNRETAQQKMRDSFEALLKAAGLTHDRFGRKRTAYSLRHSALMFRILNGDNVDLLALAKNAGTGIPMLERFYLSHLDPAMKLANLQSFKRRPVA